MGTLPLIVTTFRMLASVNRSPVARFFCPVPSLAFLSATRHRDFRLFLTGQFISLCGTWIQIVAQGWLVLQLTNSAFAVGLVTTLGSLPILLLTLYGGVVADRVNKRRFVLILQSLMVHRGPHPRRPDPAPHDHRALGHGSRRLLSGTLSAFEVPTRQALIADIVPAEDLLNGIALSSSAFDRRPSDRSCDRRGTHLHGVASRRASS